MIQSTAEIGSLPCNGYRDRQVDMVTTVLLMRVRSVISETKHNDNQLVGEEMIFFGYKGKVDNHDFISEAECKIYFWIHSQPVILT